MIRSTPLLAALASALLGSSLAAQIVLDALAPPRCRSRVALEFLAPMPAEEVPSFHPTSPNPDAWTIVLEVPCWGGAMACTGTFPPLVGPGFHPMFPSLDVRFSDAYLDTKSGTFVPGGTISGGQCGVIWNATGANLAFAFRQASVHAWYGVNGVPDTTPLGGGDDQLVYRFVMIADGQILDTDVLPQEMLITAAIEVAPGRAARRGLGG